MSTVDLPLNPGLKDASRLWRLTSSTERTRVWEWACLCGCGAAAALASTYLDFGPKVPGHAILRTVFPMALGLALVPRRGAGTSMAGSALLTALVCRGWHGMSDGLSLGALASLVATGPMMDFSLRHARRGWKLTAAFALAGLGANSIAFAVRGLAKVVGLEHIGGRPLFSWLAQAAISYPACGLVAGLMCGLVWFSSRRRRGTSGTEQPS